jgi:hypothetical protein
MTIKTHHGKNGLVKLGATTGGANAVAEVKKFSVKITAKVADNTAMGKDWETMSRAKPSRLGPGSLGCNYASGDTNGQDTLDPGTSIVLNLYPEGAPSAAHYLVGNATITEDGVDADMGSAVQRSFSFQGNGPLAWAVLA